MFLGGSNLAINANSENPELALEFLKVLTGDNFQTAYGENGLIPARKSLLDSVTAARRQAAADAGRSGRGTPASFPPASSGPRWRASRSSTTWAPPSPAAPTSRKNPSAPTTAIEEILNGN